MLAMHKPPMELRYKHMTTQVKSKCSKSQVCMYLYPHTFIHTPALHRQSWNRTQELAEQSSGFVLRGRPGFVQLAPPVYHDRSSPLMASRCASKQFTNTVLIRTHLSSAVEQNVGWLDVPMQLPLIVQVAQSPQHLRTYKSMDISITACSTCAIFGRSA